MGVKEKDLPYTDQSFRRQTRVLKEELTNLGIRLTEEQAISISFLSRRKYERYDLFYPGESFDRRLIDWLETNFTKNERQIAFGIIQCLKFISEYEMRELAVQTFENSKYTILKELSGESSNNWHSYFEYRNNRLENELAATIFVACADDIYFDFFRRYAMRYHQKLKKENFVEYYKLDKGSLNELPSHNRIFLMDQLSGSGTTALRYEDDEWKGKIPTFRKIWEDQINDVPIFYSPYILSSVSARNLKQKIPEYLSEYKLRILVTPTCNIQISPCLSNTEGTDIEEEKPVAKLCSKYYDRFVEDEHIKKAGPATYGYGKAGLTLILQSNCPNSSIPLLWHDFNDWYPLFPRITHHREV